MLMHPLARLILALAIAAPLAVGPRAAPAQTVPSPYRFVEPGQDIGPFYAWLRTDRGSAKLGPKSGSVFGLQYTLRLNGPMQVGAFAGYMSAQRDIIDPRAEGGARKIGVEDLTLIMLGGRLHLNLTGARTWHNLMPYVTGGLGMAIDATAEPTCALNPTSAQCRLSTRDRYDFGNSFMGQVGLGTAWLLSERIGLRFTVHDNIWRIKSPPGFQDADVTLRVVPSETEWVNNIMVGAGLSYWF